jgi:hypothetical protein
MLQALRKAYSAPGGASGGDSRMDAGTVLHWPVQVVQVVQQLETGETV